MTIEINCFALDFVLPSSLSLGSNAILIGKSIVEMGKKLL